MSAFASIHQAVPVTPIHVGLPWGNWPNRAPHRSSLHPPLCVHVSVTGQRGSRIMGGHEDWVVFLYRWHGYHRPWFTSSPPRGRALSGLFKQNTLACAVAECPASVATSNCKNKHVKDSYNVNSAPWNFQLYCWGFYEYYKKTFYLLILVSNHRKAIDYFFSLFQREKSSKMFFIEIKFKANIFDSIIQSAALGINYIYVYNTLSLNWPAVHQTGL